ncbi:hypothetical protein OAP14_05175 [Aliiglaciecola sp.]|nr:hypothetical protein [Aliiglaciecola sp.]
MKRLTTAIILTLSLLSNVTFAQDSVHHSGQASKHSALAASEGLASTATVASAAIAVPVVVGVGASIVAGSVIAEVGDSISESARASHASSHTHHHTLIITERTITADPAPNQAIKNNNETKD